MLLKHLTLPQAIYTACLILIILISYQSVASLPAAPGVASSIPARSHTFVKIDHEIIYTIIPLLPPTADSRRFVVSYKMYKRKYVHEVLVSRLVKPAQEKYG